MLVGMPKVPGQIDLHFVDKEIQGVRKLIESCIQFTMIENSTREKVLSAIHNQQIIHFSCHGSSLSRDPSRRGLFLHDWTSSTPLTISDLTLMNLQSPQFAYLSGCHSASARDFHLIDESINLA